MAFPDKYGPYELIERISVGGMAEVFRARRRDDGSICAVKRILPSIAQDAEFITLFEDEARIASNLDHPNIVKIFDIGKVGRSHYIALELIEGKSLRALISRAKSAGHGLWTDLVLPIAIQVAEGLEYAHELTDEHGGPRDIVHRDVSPQNIMIGFDGAVQLIDFGIAKAAGRITRTQAGAIKGKTGYMSPEQAEGLPIDRRTDVFSLGISVWEALTLTRLFDGPNELVVLDRVKNQPIPAPSERNPEIPAELDRIVLKALAKNPEERYSTARDFQADLQAFARSASISTDSAKIAGFMRSMYPQGPTSSAPPQQKSESMSEKGGSDLDVFDGLAPKRSKPPAPAPGRPGPAPPRQKTLLGLAAPAPPSSVRPPVSRPAPPPPTPSRPGAPPPSRRSVPPPAPSGRPAPAPPSSGPRPPPASAKPPPAPVDMDWDDEDEKTTVYDKAGGEDAAKALLRSAPPPPAAGAPAPAAGAAAALASSGSAGVPPPSFPRPAAVPQPTPAAPPPSEQPVSAQPPSAVTSATQTIPPPAPAGRSALIAVAALLAVGLVAALVVLLLPRSGTLLVTVAGPGNKPLDKVEVFVDGQKKCETSPCKIADLTSGSHMVHAAADGYQSTAPQGIVVESGSESVLNLTLGVASEGTGIKVTAEGRGLKLWVDGKEIGPLPQELLDMKPGQHAIKVEGSDAYEPLEKKITVRENEVQELELKPKVKKGLAKIELGDNASGAKVYLVTGGERRRLTKFPIKLSIKTDKQYQLEATKAGYSKYEKEIRFEDGNAEKDFVIDMVEEGDVVASAPSTGRISSPSRGTRSTGRATPSPSPSPAPGPKPAAGGNGTVNVNSIPVSNVILNGRPLGTTPKTGVSVPAGPVTAVFVHPEHGRKVRSTVVQPGGTATLVVRFP